jgi:hypothetical protein
VPAFDPNSRYIHLENAAQVIREDGESRRVVYKRRRFLPPLDSLQTVAEQPLQEGSRLDLLAHAYSDDAQRFWQICDANPILHPDELCAERERVIRIAASGNPQLPAADEG